MGEKRRKAASKTRTKRKAASKTKETKKMASKTKKTKKAASKTKTNKKAASKTTNKCTGWTPTTGKYKGDGGSCKHWGHDVAYQWCYVDKSYDGCAKNNLKASTSFKGKFYIHCACEEKVASE